MIERYALSRYDDNGNELHMRYGYSYDNKQEAIDVCALANTVDSGYVIERWLMTPISEIMGDDKIGGWRYDKLLGRV